MKKLRQENITELFTQHKMSERQERPIPAIIEISTTDVQGQNDKLDNRWVGKEDNDTTCASPEDKLQHHEELPKKDNMTPEQRGIKESHSTRFPIVSKYSFRKRVKKVKYYEEPSTEESNDENSAFNEKDNTHT